uniref:G-protein coupled receptors family 1 profile domain-containing protein n=1 Tax=Oryzias latipes TaxID=8090 RepID=H2MLF6_ORYLA
MEARSTFNLDFDVHPCYERNNISEMLTRTSSTKCSLLYMFLGSLSVVTVCGNLLVIIAIIYFKQLHTPSNYLILSLAVTDLLVGLVVLPISIVFALSSCLYDRGIFCKIRDSFDVVLSTTSLFNLCCISVDRYYAVCQPLTYRVRMSTRVVAVMITMSWGISIFVAIGFVVAELKQEKCKDDCFSDVVLEKVMAPVFSFYLPVLIMIYIYLRIFFVAQRQARSIQNTNSAATVSHMERKATKTLAIVMGVFLMCWLPFFLCFSLQVLGGVSVPLYETLNWFTLCNSMLNPFIYGFFYSWFRSCLIYKLLKYLKNIPS